MKTITELKDDQFASAIREHQETLKNYIIEVSNRAQKEGKPVEELIDEGLLGSIVGGVIGGTAGKSIMSAVCKALGISENSMLGQVLTSRGVLTAVGAYMGYKW